MPSTAGAGVNPSCAVHRTSSRSCLRSCSSPSPRPQPLQGCPSRALSVHPRPRAWRRTDSTPVPAFAIRSSELAQWKPSAEAARIAAPSFVSPTLVGNSCCCAMPGFNSYIAEHVRPRRIARLRSLGFGRVGTAALVALALWGLCARYPRQPPPMPNTATAGVPTAAMARAAAGYRPAHGPPPSHASAHCGEPPRRSWTSWRSLCTRSIGGWLTCSDGARQWVEESSLPELDSLVRQRPLRSPFADFGMPQRASNGSLRCCPQSGCSTVGGPPGSRPHPRSSTGGTRRACTRHPPGVGVASDALRRWKGALLRCRLPRWARWYGPLLPSPPPRWLLGVQPSTAVRR
jgi:hypothetical protein